MTGSKHKVGLSQKNIAKTPRADLGSIPVTMTKLKTLNMTSESGTTTKRQRHKRKEKQQEDHPGIRIRQRRVD